MLEIFMSSFFFRASGVVNLLVSILPAYLFDMGGVGRLFEHYAL